MTRIEDRLRDYYEVRARAVEADAIRPSVRPAPGRSRALPRLRTLPRRTLVAPLAAAAAVAAVSITAVALGSANHPGQTPPSLPAGGKSIAQLVSAGVIPPRFVTITADGGSSYAAVRSTATGARLATIRPSVPHGTIVAVTGAADDRTFVLAEQKLPVTRTASLNIDHGSFFLLRLRSDGTREALTELPVNAGDGVNAMALSADGTKLAIASRLDSGSAELRVYTLATGAVRTWSAGGSGFVGDGLGGPDDAASVSWAADGRHLLFNWVGKTTDEYERLLDTSLGGSSLLADSRLVLTIPSPVGQPLFCQGDVVITPDGSALICPGLTERDPANSNDDTVFFREYSTATGKAVRQLGAWTFYHTDQFRLGALWTNSSGSVIIGVIPTPSQSQSGPTAGPTPDPDVTPSPPPGSSPRIGVIIGGTFTPLGLPGVTSGVW